MVRIVVGFASFAKHTLQGLRWSFVNGTMLIFDIFVLLYEYLGTT